VAARKKVMGRGLGSLLDRPRNKPAATPAAGGAIEADAPVAQPVDAAADKAPLNKESSEPATAPEAKAAPAAAAPGEQTAANGDKLRLLGIDQIQRGTYQPRRHFDPDLLQELADSLKSEGLIQPILVRANAGGGFELIAGERRWRAAQLAGLTEIPAIVRTLDDRAVAAVALIENIQRKDLNPLEEAQALARLCEEFGLSHQEVADSVGRSRSAVTNLMRLLELHDDAKVLVDTGEIDMGHARALLGAPYDEQATLARRIAKQGLTVRAVEQQIKALRTGKEPGRKSREVSDPDIDRLATHLGEKLGAAVTIKHQPSGAGRLDIRYNSLAELDGILNHIK